jgi:5-methyltetrahydropteroyltriglutamate--homocysteine methyltransferase
MSSRCRNRRPASRHDGEFRRDWWHIDFLHGFEGIELSQAATFYGDAKFKNIDEQPPTLFVAGKIRRTRPNMVDHFKLLNP